MMGGVQDYRTLFASSPDAYLVLAPDLTIVEVTDAYLKATMTERDEIIGRGLFEIFPDANPENPTPGGVVNLCASLETVLRTKAPHEMAVQPRPRGVWASTWAPWGAGSRTWTSTGACSTCVGATSARAA